MARGRGSRSSGRGVVVEADAATVEVEKIGIRHAIEKMSFKVVSASS